MYSPTPLPTPQPTPSPTPRCEPRARVDSLSSATERDLEGRAAKWICPMHGICAQPHTSTITGSVADPDNVFADSDAYNAFADYA